MIIEIDDDLLDRWSPEQLLAVRPRLEDLAVRMRRSLRLLDSLMDIEADRPNLAREHDRLCYDHHHALNRIEALEHDLATARAWVSTLQSKLVEFEDDEIEYLYRSVGLTSTAHVVVVAAARRALLAHHHPDRAAPEQKERASAKFVAATEAFDRIMELRR